MFHNEIKYAILTNMIFCLYPMSDVFSSDSMYHEYPILCWRDLHTLCAYVGLLIPIPQLIKRFLSQDYYSYYVLFLVFRCWSVVLAYFVARNRFVRLVKRMNEIDARMKMLNTNYTESKASKFFPVFVLVIVLFTLLYMNISFISLSQKGFVSNLVYLLPTLGSRLPQMIILLPLISSCDALTNRFRNVNDALNISVLSQYGFDVDKRLEELRVIHGQLCSACQQLVYAYNYQMLAYFFCFYSLILLRIAFSIITFQRFFLSRDGLAIICQFALVFCLVKVMQAVQDESRSVLVLLRETSLVGRSKEFCFQLKQFTQQAHLTSVTVSVLGFFPFDKPFIVTVIQTTVNFALLMVQMEPSFHKILDKNVVTSSST